MNIKSEMFEKQEGVFPSSKRISAAQLTDTVETWARLCPTARHTVLILPGKP